MTDERSSRPYAAPIALRLLVTVLAVAAVALLLPRLAGARACEDARTAAFAYGSGAPVRPAELARLLRERCDDPEALAAGVVVLQDRGARREALALARLASQRYPASFDAWAALARAGGGAAAERRVRALAPR